MHLGAGRKRKRRGTLAPGSELKLLLYKKGGGGLALATIEQTLREVSRGYRHKLFELPDEAQQAVDVRDSVHMYSRHPPSPVVVE